MFVIVEALRNPYSGILFFEAAQELQISGTRWAQCRRFEVPSPSAENPFRNFKSKAALAS
jgi:hypothetical protein